jgi:predicted nuclease with RNAse H fold
MSRRSRSNPIAIGIDVGGSVKGFHAVALRGGKLVGTYATRSVSALADWCRAYDAGAVGIDAPCRWSETGRARACEKALAAEGMRCFATPGRWLGERHPFYQWMCHGIELYRLLATGFRLFDGRWPATGPVCFETFPHAVACSLANRRLSAARKYADRRRLLRAAGLSTVSLTTIDLVDAALCALAAQSLLAGTFRCYGEQREGFIVLPNRDCPPEEEW